MTNSQLWLAIGIPTFAVLFGIVLNQLGLNRLSDKVDHHYENFNNQVTTLLTTIHSVDVRLVKLETKGEK